MATVPPSYTASKLPAYSPNPPNERFVTAGGPSASSTTPDEYQYNSSHLLLNLGPKRWGTFRPTYGWNDVIEGYVHVKKDTKHVQSVAVTICGHVTTGVTERGFLTDQTRTIVLRMSQSLFDSPSEKTLPNGDRYSFSFPLPSYITGQSDPLPPTFAALGIGVAVDVTYFIQVEMVRKGRLRPTERIKAFFFYLPRTYAPLAQQDLPSHQDVKITSDDGLVSWKNIKLVPSRSRGNMSSTVSDLSSSISISFALPRPCVYASGSKIPFSLQITSGATTEAISSLFSSLSILLIRVTSIRAGSVDKWSVSETVIGGGEIYRIEEREDARNMLGSVNCSRMGESSWHADGVEVKHLIRVKVSPCSDLPSLARTLPTYRHDVVVKIRTDLESLDGTDDRTTPALCSMPRPLGM